MHDWMLFCADLFILELVFVSLANFYFIANLATPWPDSGKSEPIQWEKIKPPTDEVVVPYDKMSEFSDGNSLCMCKMILTSIY